VIHSTAKAHSPPADAIAGYVIELARGASFGRLSSSSPSSPARWRIATLLANQLVMIRPGSAR
jgi:hypothetical protein